MWLIAEFEQSEKNFETFETILVQHNVEAWERLCENADYQFDNLALLPHSAIKIVIDDCFRNRELLSDIELASGIRPRLALQDEKSWNEEWKKFYKPQEIGKRLCVRPVWEKYDNEERIVCILEPGSVFGTGLHQTTQLCMEFLDSEIKGDEKVLDLGTGTGILALCALQLGAAYAIGIDIEPNTKEIALKNAALNGLENRFEIKIGDIMQDVTLLPKQSHFEVVIANIVSSVIITIAPVVKRLLCTNGIFIISGIIDDRLENTKFILEEIGFKIIAEKSRDAWSALILKLK